MEAAIYISLRAAGINRGPKKKYTAAAFLDGGGPWRARPWPLLRHAWLDVRLVAWASGAGGGWTGAASP
jgi:hypothetical protein